MADTTRTAIPIAVVSSCIAILIFLWWRNSATSSSQTQNSSSNTVNKVVLQLPREPANDEDITANISVGTLPRDASISVTTDDGKIAGSIFPFGQIPGAKAVDHAIPIERSAVKDGKVTLHMEVLERDKAPRPPLSSEVEGAELLLVPVTREKSEVPK